LPLSVIDSRPERREAELDAASGSSFPVHPIKRSTYRALRRSKISRQPLLQAFPEVMADRSIREMRATASLGNEEGVKRRSGRLSPAANAASGVVDVLSRIVTISI
jgi:hypothetical protein